MSKKDKSEPGGWEKVRVFFVNNGGFESAWRRAHNLRTELVAAGLSVRIVQKRKGRVAVYAREKRVEWQK